MAVITKLAAAMLVAPLFASSAEARTRHTYNYQYHESVHQRYYQHYRQQHYWRYDYQNQQNQRKQIVHRSKKISKKYVKRRYREIVDANGMVVSRKTGAKAWVAKVNAPKFQAYIDDLENNHGATIYFMGGLRKGRCSSGSQHPCGKALDVCQLEWGAVDKRCNLPGRLALAAIALKNGLFEGGMWCSNDYGHAQVSFSAEACGRNLYASIAKFKNLFVTEAKASESGEDKEALAYDTRQPVIRLADNELDHVIAAKKKRQAKRHYAKRHHKRYASR